MQLGNIEQFGTVHPAGLSMDRKAVFSKQVHSHMLNIDSFNFIVYLQELCYIGRFIRNDIGETCQVSRRATYTL